jgi:uroporphyrinogen decarboxylase
MDKRTRLISTIEGKEVDRPPVCFWFHFEGRRASGEGTVRAHLDYYRHSNPDFLKCQSDGFFPFPLELPITSASDWKHLRPLSRQHPYVADQVERVRRINDALHGECCTYYTVFAPFSSIRFATSDELVMAHFRENPKAVAQALETVAETNMVVAQSIIREGGCTGIFLSLQGGEENRFSSDEYRELISPSELRVLSAANEASRFNIGHLCAWAGVRNHLEVWRDYPFPVVNWAVHIEGMSLAEGKQYFGGRTVMGGFDNRKQGVIFRGSEAEIKRATREILTANPGPGLIISADCSLQMESDIDLDHILWVVEAAQEWADHGSGKQNRTTAGKSPA